MDYFCLIILVSKTALSDTMVSKEFVKNVIQNVFPVLTINNVWHAMILINMYLIARYVNKAMELKMEILFALVKFNLFNFKSNS